MSEVFLDVDTSRFDKRWASFQRVLTNLPGYLVSDTADIAEQEMKIEIPKGGSGDLEASVSKTVNGNTAEVRTNTGYGKAVDEGRRGFHVEAHGRALRFVINGKVIFAKSANPGPASANNFKMRTILTTGRRAIMAIKDRTNSEISTI